MKKFLNLDFSSEAREIPSELDAVILATAKMRSGRIRKRNTAVKVALPTLATAAASVLALALIPGTENGGAPVNSSVISHPSTIAHNVQMPAVKTVSATDYPKTMLPQMAPPQSDTTSLEMDYYNLANMVEFSLDTDNFTI